MTYSITTGYCSYCQEETEHEKPDHSDAPDAICRECQREVV